MSMNKTQRCQAAMDYRRQGLNCSQCLLAAFADAAGLTLEQAMALGAGMGGLRGALQRVQLDPRLPERGGRSHCPLVRKYGL